MPYLMIVVRCLIGTVFLSSLAGKLAGRGAFAAFAQSVRQWRILPPPLVRPTAAVVVAAEAVVCLLVTAGPPPAGDGGLILAALLLTVFAAAIGETLRRGAGAACRCFGPSAVPLSRWHVARNLVLVAAALFGAAAAPEGGARPGGAALAAVTGLLLAVVVVKLDDLLALFRPTVTPPGRTPVNPPR
ncbi:MauE/DoxX family redox-associated membrane protein [Actinoplanes flavus]|uniref:Methylamine utilisation protein MauE domain-containing protein n=1 Tax=Actinoplanes flavus TaxID=2820290 RepID=A0ABS3V0L9_9ACTN|nr:MauE/DoxX family redox-associated membrane protein [Actinoplanes flavus]MBO3744375.1 hypothetical protein [Actinoplanes flavus]